MDFYTMEKYIYIELLEEDEGANFITFKYMLPFRLPLRPTESFRFGDTLFVPFHRQYEHYAKNEGFAEVPIKNTIIEATVKISKSAKRNIIKEKERAKGRKKTRYLSKVFDKQLKKLNEFIEVIIMKYEFFHIYKIYLSDLVGVSYYQLYQYKDNMMNQYNYKGILILEVGSRIAHDGYQMLGNSEVKEIMDDFEEYKNHAYKRIVQPARRGERAYYLNDYDSAIIHYNTMFEVLIIFIVRDFYKLNKEKEDNKIFSIISKNGLKNIIEDHFYKILSRLQLKDHQEIKRAVKKYLAEGYMYRNNIVHKAINYGEEEASSVILNMKDLVYLLNYNIGKAEINDFVEHYNNHMSNLHEDLYEEVIGRYRK